MPAPRFLGWREWASIEPHDPKDAVPCRRAIWSDEERLDGSDGFDLAGWRLDCDAGLRGSSHRAHERSATARRVYSARPPEPVKSAGLGDLPRKLGISHSPGVSAERVLYGGAGRQRPGQLPLSARLPSLDSNANAKLQTAREVPSGKDLADLSHAALSLNAQTFSVCRGDVLSVLAERDQQLAELAAQRRARVTEAGLEHRRLAAQWRERMAAGSRQVCAESVASRTPCHDGESQQPQDKETVRSLRQQRNIQRIAASDPSDGGQREEGARRGEASRRLIELMNENEISEGRLELRQRLWARLARAAKKGWGSKRIQMRAFRQARFSELPAEVQLLCREAFDFYKEKGGTVKGENLQRCLTEMGLHGKTTAEKHTIKRVVQDVIETIDSEAQQDPSPEPVKEKKVEPRASRRVSALGSCTASLDGKLSPVPRTAPEIPPCQQRARFSDPADIGQAQLARSCLHLEDFATELVPAVRNALLLERTDDHFKIFMEAMPDKNSISLTLDELQSMCHDLQFDKQAVKEILDSLALKHRNTRKRRSEGGQSSQVFFFEAVHDILMWLEEKAEHRRRNRERQLQADTGLSWKLFWVFRDELLQLYELFCQHDSESSGFLSHEDAVQMLAHLGLQPSEPSVQPTVRKLLCDSSSTTKEKISFEEFLETLQTLRAHEQKLRERKLVQEFWKFDVDRNGLIDAKEMVNGLLLKGISPQMLGSAPVQRILEDFDRELNSGLTFDQFQFLCQRIVERLFSLMNERHLQQASQLGFDARTMQEFRCVFEHLDLDGNQMLSMSEVELALRTFMNSPIGLQRLKVHFQSVDLDRDGQIDFRQFLELVKLMGNDKLSLSKAQMFTIRMGTNGDQRRQILRVFSLACSFVRCLDDSELLEQVCNLTGLQPDVDLKTLMEPIRDFDELIDFARARALQFAKPWLALK